MRLCWARCPLKGAQTRSGAQLDGGGSGHLSTIPCKSLVIWRQSTVEVAGDAFMFVVSYGYWVSRDGDKKIQSAVKQLRFRNTCSSVGFGFFFPP